ncbi:energy transducer TonB, partial [Herbaspirillum frisingense]
MNAISPSLMSVSPPSALLRQARKIGPLGLIILLHIAFFWALQSGLVKQAVNAVPKEVIATFIVPEKAPEPAPPKAEPVPPKQVKIVKKVVAPPKPIPVTETPTPTSITAPPQPPQPATPAPQAAAE